jgi:hypothetical protein
MPNSKPNAALELHALGHAYAVFHGHRLHLSQRQLEILCIFALHPEGLSLADLHHALCSNVATTQPTTIKTMLTALRHVLDGQIGSHPYRLLIPVWADFRELSDRLQQHNIAEALALYRGALLPLSIAPALEEYRHHLDASMDALLRSCTSAQLLIDHADNLFCTPLIRERLLALLK